MKYIVYEVTKTELIKIDKVKATNSDIAIKKALIGTTRDPKKKYFAINYQRRGVGLLPIDVASGCQGRLVLLVALVPRNLKEEL